MFFFFNDTATTEIYTLSLHDALPIYLRWSWLLRCGSVGLPLAASAPRSSGNTNKRVKKPARSRSEEHTSELQSRQYLVCRLLLEKKKEKTCRHCIIQNIFD